MYEGRLNLLSRPSHVGANVSCALVTDPCSSISMADDARKVSSASYWVYAL